MTPPFLFQLNTPMARGLQQLLLELEQRLEITRPIKVWLAGGMAVHLYTGQRVTTDVDAEFGARLLLPLDLAVEIESAGQPTRLLYLDTNYNSSFALMHEDYQDNALPVPLALAYLQVHVLSPVDLAVSKLARWAENDHADVAALLGLRLFSGADLQARAHQALAGYIGSQRMLLLNLRDALALAATI